MPGFVSPLTRAVTYTRWLHILMGSAVTWVCAAIYPGLSRPTFGDWVLLPLLPVPLVVAAAMVPAMRRAEGLQARMMLFPGAPTRVADGSEYPAISVTPSASWRDRGRTAVWLVLGLEAGCAMALAAHRLLGPSPAERLAALEERTEQLLERNRVARELHDSIGHALTVAVVQAGAAKAAADPEFTDRTLDAVVETGGAALEDLECVLRVLREDGRPASGRPSLTDAERLLESARASGATVDVEVTGPVERLPGPVSREGYRMLQEALTNVLRHCGPVPVRLRITVDEARLVMDVRNALTGANGGSDSGLRAIQQRAALLGGRVATGPCDGEWRVRVELPVG
ncbi:sensor histidine kinase [Streptomyces sp. NPDC017988]|uniref:sensor histidine kinase n=1 Tax=Streptomyces sp. NPDC017988 TaxID=3365025 RepID=UPI00378A2354